MGTRAVIKFGDSFIATHWDGYPNSLGRDLFALRDRNLENIIEVAKAHSIDFATDDVLSSLLLIDNSSISPWGNYGDWAEFIYDVYADQIRFAKLRGSWSGYTPESFEWRILTENMIE